jgi:hypothetical protein
MEEQRRFYLEARIVKRSDGMTCGAYISQDGRYRYYLLREWDREKPMLMICMLNPSTADVLTDDPTVRRCMNFARREKFGGIEIVNLFNLRTPNPEIILRHPDPKGPQYELFLGDELFKSRPVLCAWGSCGFGWRVDEMVKRMRGAGAELFCLGKNKDGNPKHPLYVPNTQPMVEWNPFESV